jgi:hypothetical protein
MTVDEALNGCPDRSFFGSLLGWSDEVTVEVKIVVTSTPDFPRAETKRLNFSGGAGLNVTNDVTFTLDPTLEAEVRIDGARLQMARLEARGRMEVRQELNILATASGRVDATVPLIGERRFVKVFMAGQVPVVMSGAFTVEVRVEGDVTGALNVNEALSFSLEDMLYGVRYEGGIWTTPKAARPVHRFTLLGEGDATAKLKISLLPKLNVGFYEALTGRLVLVPYIEAEAGVKGRVALDAVVDSVTADADWWISAGKVSGGVDAYAMADLSVFERTIAQWPAGANPDRYETWLPKINLRDPVPILGIPTLSATVDLNAKHPSDSRAILIRGAATNVPNPFKTLFGGPDALVEFRNWTAPVVVAAGSIGYKSIPNPPGSATGDHWIVFDRAGSYRVRLGAVSSLGGWARQIAEATIDLTDLNSNGIVDQWETKHGLSGSGTDIAVTDPDRDGRQNYMEWRLGTDPLGPDVTAPVVSSVSTRSSVASDWAPVSQGGITSDRKLLIEGTVNRPLQPGQQIRILDGYRLMEARPVMITADTWRFAPESDQSSGEHDFVAVVLDAAGSVVGASRAWALTIGTQTWTTEVVRVPGIERVVGVADDGTVVLTLYVEGKIRVAKLQQGSVSLLPLLPGFDEAMTANGRRVVARNGLTVGTVRTFDRTDGGAVCWGDHGVTRMALPVGYQTTMAMTVSSSGKVWGEASGYVNNIPRHVPVAWNCSDGRILSFDASAQTRLSYDARSLPADVNDSGTQVGVCDSPTVEVPSNYSACIVKDGMETIFLLPTPSYGIRINENGTVIRKYYRVGAGGPPQEVWSVGSGSTWTELAMFMGPLLYSGWPLVLGSADEVVLSDSIGVRLYSRGRYQELIRYGVGPASDVQLVYAAGMNASGLIALTSFMKSGDHGVMLIKRTVTW